MTTNPLRRPALGLLACGLIALSGCGRHHRHELQGAGGEPPLTEPDDERPTLPINNRESPTVLRWAGGD